MRRRSSSQSPVPRRRSSLTASAAADPDRPTPPDEGRALALGGPEGFDLIVVRDTSCSSSMVVTTPGHRNRASHHAVYPRSAARHPAILRPAVVFT